MDRLMRRIEKLEKKIDGLSEKKEHSTATGLRAKERNR